MSTFQYEEASESPRPETRRDDGIDNFWAPETIEKSMSEEFTQFPWESTVPDISVEESGTVMPAQMSIVTVVHRRAQEVARDHIRQVAPKIGTSRARDGFMRGAGMFDVCAPPADLDDTLG